MAATLALPPPLILLSLCLAVGATILFLSWSPPRRRSSPGIRSFTPKHFLSFQANILSGVTLGCWLRIVWSSKFRIDWPRYGLRVLFLTNLACFNSMLALIEGVLYGRAIAAAEINPRPVFVLGHPRTGTTHLFNLLSLNEEAFNTCTTFHCGFPSCFLWFKRFKWALAGMVPKTRPMDNMALGLDTPQEDELATNVLSSGTSPYMPLIFMRHERDYRPFFTFDQASDAERSRWTDAFLYFLRKLTVNGRRGGGGGGGSGSSGVGAAGDRRLLLKSPVHTARVKLLLQLFPDAQFIYIHRDPYTVFKSAANMADTTYWHSYLSVPTDEEITEFILSQFVALHREYVAARGAIPAGNLVELSFDELTADGPKAIERIYTELGWGELAGGPHARRLHEYCAGQRTYKKNVHRPLPPDLMEVVRRRWAEHFVEFGYKP